MNILVVEDDSRISEFVIKGLEEQGHTATLACSGEIARELIMAAEWDIILMDIMLPGIDGVQLTKLVRYKHNTTPILMLSALGETDDKVLALDAGADDYLVKPFHFKELLSRMNALVRRTKFGHLSPTQVYQCGALVVHVEEHTVQLEEKRLELSPKEYKLLVYLLEHQNKVRSRVQLVNAVWGIDYDHNTNIVDVYISYLRAKIEHTGQKFIHTIKGIGYMLKQPQ